MKSFVWLFLLFIPFISNAQFGHNHEVVAGKVETQDKKGLNLRACPDIKCPVVDGLSEGKIYFFLPYDEGDWLNIRGAYAHKDYIKIVQGEIPVSRKTKMDWNREKKLTQYSFAKIIRDFKIDKKNHPIVFGENNGITVKSFGYISRRVRRAELVHNNISYDMIQYKGNTYFTDGKKTYCGSYSIKDTYVGLAWDNKTKRILDTFGNAPQVTEYSYDTYPAKIYSYSSKHKCLTQIFDDHFDTAQLAEYSSKIFDARELFTVREKYEYQQLNKNELKNISLDFLGDSKADLTAAQLSYSRNPKEFFHFDSPNYKNMEIKDVAPGISLNIKYKSFVFAYTGKGSLSHLKNSRSAIHANDDMEVNGFQILKGEYVKLQDLAYLTLIAKQFPTLKKNIDFGFARTIDQKNYSVDNPSLFFNLSKLKIDSELYEISPYYITSIKEFSDQLSVLPRQYNNVPPSKVDRKFSKANKFFNQRLGLTISKEAEKADNNYCYENLDDIKFFEQKIKEWGIPIKSILSIEYIDDLGMYELILNDSVEAFDVSFAPQSKLYIQKIACKASMNLISAIVEPGTKWNQKTLNQKTNIKFESLKPIELITDSQTIYSKHKIDLDHTLKQNIKRYPLCIKNILIQHNPLKIKPCGNYIHDEIQFFEVQSYDGKSQTLIINEHKYHLSDVTSLFTVRAEKKEFWLPFLYDLQPYVFDPVDLIKLVDNQQIIHSKVDHEGNLIGNLKRYCGDLSSARHLSKEQGEMYIKSIKGDDIKVRIPIPYNQRVEIKMQEPLRQMHQVCEVGC